VRELIAVVVVLSATQTAVAPALAERVSLPIAPVTGDEELAGDAFGAEVQLTLPPRGRVERDSFESQPPSRLWRGSRFTTRGGDQCRVVLELHAWAYEKRPRYAGGRHKFRRGGVTFHSSEAELDEVRAISGSAWFRLPADVATGHPHRYVTVLVAAWRGQDHCIRPIRRRAGAIVDRGLKSLRLLRAPPSA
jgi:hypothetical protein